MSDIPKQPDVAAVAPDWLGESSHISSDMHEAARQLEATEVGTVRDVGHAAVSALPTAEQQAADWPGVSHANTLPQPSGEGWHK